MDKYTDLGHCLNSLICASEYQVLCGALCDSKSEPNGERNNKTILSQSHFILPHRITTRKLKSNQTEFIFIQQFSILRVCFNKVQD